LNLNISNHSHFSFDLWLTLIKSNPVFKEKRNLLFRDFFEMEVPLEKVFEVVRYYDVLCNNVNEKTGFNFDTYEIYYLILNALGVNINDIDKKVLYEFYLESELLFMKFKPVLIYPKIHSLFTEILDEGKTINILSNTGFIKGNTLRNLLDFYEISNYFLFQIYSDEEGISKPNKKIFQLIYNRLEGIDKKKVLHIGDNLIADYEGATNFGFDALLIKNKF
jgi:putative hydrolase of the HAD superfamily